MADPFRVVVVGASLGGFDALARLARDLPPDFPAAVLAVLHLAPTSTGDFAQAVRRAGPLPAALAVDGEPLRGGRIALAPPDRHLLVADGHVRLSAGPRENRARPAVDPLFRSAAVACRERAVGVVLTGLLDDGAAGLRAVERCGGAAVVQSPADAASADMPLAALAAVPAAHRVPLADLGALLDRLVRTPAPPPPPVPPALLAEARLTETPADRFSLLDRLGERVPISCPDCGGPLWQLHGERPPRYRCHTGHVVSEQALAEGQAEQTEQALYVALRTLEERCRMLRRLAAQSGEAAATSGGYAERAAEVEGHAETLRAVLARLPTGRG